MSAVAPPPAAFLMLLLATVVGQAGPVASAAYVPLLRTGDTVPEVALVDQTGRRASLRGGTRPTIVSFAYTRCGDARMCPLVTAKFGRLARMLQATGIRLLEVTLDPQNDRPAVLARYARAFAADRRNWIFATGRPSDVYAFAARFGVALERSANGALTHREAVAIVSQDGVVRTLLDGNSWSVADLAAEARAAAALPSDPVRRFALQLFAAVGAACGGRGGGIPTLGGIAIFFVSLLAAGIAAVRLFARAFANTTKPRMRPH